MTSVSLLLAAAAFAPVIESGGFGLTSAFVPLTNRATPSHIVHRLHSTVLLSTTESDARSKTSSSDENGNDDNDGDDSNLQNDILSGLDRFAASELTENKGNDNDQPMKELDVDLSDEDFVLVGGRAAIERDDALTMVSSELSIWTNLRKKSLTPATGLPIDVILQRTWDTVEDVWAHLRRIPFEKGWTELSDEAEVTRKTVVVLGSGWASHALSKVADCQKIRLIVVSPSNPCWPALPLGRWSIGA